MLVGSCYYDDRILLPIASLEARGFGILRDVIVVHVKTLEEATFKLKLSSKISNESYKQLLECDFSVVEEQ